MLYKMHLVIADFVHRIMSIIFLDMNTMQSSGVA